MQIHETTVTLCWVVVVVSIRMRTRRDKKNSTTFNRDGPTKTACFVNDAHLYHLIRCHTNTLNLQNSINLCTNKIPKT